MPEIIFLSQEYCQDCNQNNAGSDQDSLFGSYQVRPKDADEFLHINHRPLLIFNEGLDPAHRKTSRVLIIDRFQRCPHGGYCLTGERIPLSVDGQRELEFVAVDQGY